MAGTHRCRQVLLPTWRWLDSNSLVDISEQQLLPACACADTSEGREQRKGSAIVDPVLIHLPPGPWRGGPARARPPAAPPHPPPRDFFVTHQLVMSHLVLHHWS